MPEDKQFTVALLDVLRDYFRSGTLLDYKEWLKEQELLTQLCSERGRPMP